MTTPETARTEAPADGEYPGGRFVIPATAARREGTAGFSDGLARLLEVLAAQMPRHEVESVWSFPELRREGREHGVAVVSRRDSGERRRVYRARYVTDLKGRDCGRVVVDLEETAATPGELLPRVIEGVRRRADEAGEAELLDLTTWKAARDDGAGES